jgi:hypothetical protein
MDLGFWIGSGEDAVAFILDRIAWNRALLTAGHYCTPTGILVILC